MAVDPDKPFNREEMYLAKAAGEGTTVPDEPWSRKEAYLNKISGRLDGIDAKIAALATDISLKGGVADYDHLPTDAAVGDAYITEDTGILYVWVGDEWTPLNMQGGSGIKELTTEDYNYHRTGDTDDGVALWLIDAGFYVKKDPAIRIYDYSSTAEGLGNFGQGDTIFYIVSKAKGYATIMATGGEYMEHLRSWRVLISNGNSPSSMEEMDSHYETVLTGQMTIDKIIPASDTNRWMYMHLPLSAKQGYELDNKINMMLVTNDEFNTMWENA